MMNYEKAYKDLTRKIKDALADQDVADADFGVVIGQIAPELAESEDEKIRKAISAAICGTTAETVLEANGVRLVDALSYLEKQKEQKPAEWSEEDKEMKLKILKYLSTRCSVIEFEEVENWLNNLSIRPRWYPSEEQMMALEIACNLTDDAREHIMLSSLYEQLKSL